MRLCSGQHAGRRGRALCMGMRLKTAQKHAMTTLVNTEDHVICQLQECFFAWWFTLDLLVGLLWILLGIMQDGDTPLHTAAKEGCVDSVHALLALGAEVKAVNYVNSSRVSCTPAGTHTFTHG